MSGISVGGLISTKKKKKKRREGIMVEHSLKILASEGKKNTPPPQILTKLSGYVFSGTVPE